MSEEQKLELWRQIVALLSSAVGLPAVLLYLFFTERRRHWAVQDAYLLDYKESISYYRKEASDARLESARAQMQIFNLPRGAAAPKDLL